MATSLCCGQAFGWTREGEWFYGFVGGRPVAVRQHRSFIEWKGRAAAKDVARYFRLDDDMPAVVSAVGSDAFMREAAGHAQGLRLLRQDPWECSVSFICSAYANIPRIGKMLDNLRRKYGKRSAVDGVELFSFPSPKQLARAPAAELKKCGLGYRAAYVKGFAQAVAGGGLDFAELRRLPYAEAKEILLRHKGVGEKVADCILLFSLDRLEAFPVDVWIKRIMLRHYGKGIRRLAGGRKPSERIVREFAQAKFGKHAGYAQEFMYAARKRVC